MKEECITHVLDSKEKPIILSCDNKDEINIDELLTSFIDVLSKNKGSIESKMNK